MRYMGCPNYMGAAPLSLQVVTPQFNDPSQAFTIPIGDVTTAYQATAPLPGTPAPVLTPLSTSVPLIQAGVTSPSPSTGFLAWLKSLPANPNFKTYVGVAAVGALILVAMSGNSTKSRRRLRQ